MDRSAQEVESLPDKDGNVVKFRYASVRGAARIVSPAGMDLNPKIVLPTDGSRPYVARRSVDEIIVVSENETAQSALAAQSENNGVYIPADYVYNPKLGRLHDYCTDSPDYYGYADFRGACARHDMCYEAAKKSKHSCNLIFRQNLLRVCKGLNVETAIEGYPAVADDYFVIVEKANG